MLLMNIFQDNNWTSSRVSDDYESYTDDFEGGSVKNNHLQQNIECIPNEDADFQRLPASQKKESWIDGLVISILSITALSNSAYAIIAPFLPFEFKRKGIDQDWIGYIFSIYSVAVIFGSPLVGHMIVVLGRRNIIVFGMFCMGASFIVFGLISDTQNKATFIGLSLLNRFLQGLSSCMIQTTMYSISTNFYPENKESMVGFIEAVTGVGLIMGPLIGSFFYAIGGY